MEKKVLNSIYESLLVTLGAVGISMASKKILKEPLSTPESIKGTLRLAVAVATGTYLIKYAQDKKQLAKSKETFYENEIRHKDKIAQLRMQLSDANNDINQTNKSLDILAKIKQLESNTFSPKEPQLNDFYKPSPEMQKYQNITVGIIGVGSGYLAHKYIS